MKKSKGAIDFSSPGPYSGYDIWFWIAYSRILLSSSADFGLR